MYYDIGLGCAVIGCVASQYGFSVVTLPMFFI